MLLSLIIAFFPFNVQFQAFDGILWTAFDAGPCHVEADTEAAVAVWCGQSGEPVAATAAYWAIAKD